MNNAHEWGHSSFTLRVLADVTSLRKRQLAGGMDPDTRQWVALARMLADAVFFVSLYQDAMDEPLGNDGYDLQRLLDLYKKVGSNDPCDAFGLLECHLENLPGVADDRKTVASTSALRHHHAICSFIPSLARASN